MKVNLVFLHSKTRFAFQFEIQTFCKEKQSFLNRFKVEAGAGKTVREAKLLAVSMSASLTANIALQALAYRFGVWLM
jgi:hypothetical protein